MSIRFFSLLLRICLCSVNPCTNDLTCSPSRHSWPPLRLVFVFACIHAHHAGVGTRRHRQESSRDPHSRPRWPVFTPRVGAAQGSKARWSRSGSVDGRHSTGGHTVRRVTFTNRVMYSRPVKNSCYFLLIDCCFVDILKARVGVCKPM